MDAFRSIISLFLVSLKLVLVFFIPLGTKVFFHFFCLVYFMPLYSLNKSYSHDVVTLSVVQSVVVAYIAAKSVEFPLAGKPKSFSKSFIVCFLLSWLTDLCCKANKIHFCIYEYNISSAHKWIYLFLFTLRN